MWNYWRTLNGMARFRLAIARLITLVLEDIRGSFIHGLSQLLRYTSIHAYVKHLALKLGIVQLPSASNYESTVDNIQFDKKVTQKFSTKQLSITAKPKIFVSACVDEKLTGGWKYNGGIKELNYLVKLLRNYGYEAYMVTYDGNFEPWLIEHQPHISLDEFRSRLKSLSLVDVRCVTSYAIAKAFIHECEQLYFWDMELAYTENEHFPILASLYRHKIVSTAAISRTIQAWHMANFWRSCTLLPNLLDTSVWFPTSYLRKSYRIGYMNEGPHTKDYIGTISNLTKNKGFEFEFYCISGVESEILSAMHSCDVFLSMNLGKDTLWGEGCPRTVIEALASGCVVIAFDVIGNREIIQDNFNGVLVSRYRPDLMADSLVKIYTVNCEFSRLRENSSALIEACHTFNSRWSAVKQFLHL